MRLELGSKVQFMEESISKKLDSKIHEVVEELKVGQGLMMEEALEENRILRSMLKSKDQRLLDVKAQKEK